MQDYIDGYEKLFKRPAAMDGTIAEDLQVAMLLAFFGEKKQSPFGYVLESLQTIQEKVHWGTGTATLFQEYDEHHLRNVSKAQKSGQPVHALQMNGSGVRTHRGKKNVWSRQDKRRCFECRKVGHVARHCLMKSGNHSHYDRKPVAFVGETGGHDTGFRRAQ